MFTVIPWFTVRRSRRTLAQHVTAALTDKPTVLAIVSEKYTNDHHIRPFAPLAEQLEGRVNFIVVAEFEQRDRELMGEPLLVQLGLSPEARRRMLRDEGETRIVVLLRQKKPVGLIEAFFVERAYRGLDGEIEPRAEEMAARQDTVLRAIEETLRNLPPPAPPPPRILAPGEHDFGQNGLCQRCGEGRATYLACPGTKRDDGPKRDRFELIELD